MDNVFIERMQCLLTCEAVNSQELVDGLAMSGVVADWIAFDVPGAAPFGLGLWQ